MSRATRLINRLDKVLARHDSFGDDPAAFVDSVFAEIEDSPEEMADLIGEYMGEAGEIELHEIDEKN